MRATHTDNPDNLVLRRRAQTLTLERQELPAPGSTDVVFRILRAAVCGTDRQILRGDRPDRAEVLGHEGVAEVAATGSKVVSFRRGDRFVFNPVNPTDQDEILGHSTEGIFQRFLTLPEAELRRRSLVEPVPARIPIEACVLAEPLGTVLYTHEFLEAVGSLLILGSGSMGVLHALYAQRVRLVEHIHLVGNSTARARWLHAANVLPEEVVVHDLAETHSLPAEVDAVLSCVPARSTGTALAVALQAVRNGGCLGLIGGVDRPRREELPGVDLAGVRRANVCGKGDAALTTVSVPGNKTVRLFGHRGAAPRHLSGALDLLLSDPVFHRVLTHRVGLAALPRVLDTLRHQNELAGTPYLKAVVDCTSDADYIEVRA